MSSTRPNIFEQDVEADGVISDTTMVFAYGKSGTPTLNITWANFVTWLKTKLNIVQSGVVCMWASSKPIPTGWVICNGSNGTQDLRDYFIVGYSQLDSDYNSVGKTGGENSHILIDSEMPLHSHTVDVYNGDTSEEYSFTGGGSGINIDDLLFTIEADTTSSIGGGVAHENRPPYYALIFIMKV